MSQQKEQSKLAFHVSLSKQVAEQFRRGTNSLLMPHNNAGKSLPYNPITGKTYTAINSVLLSAKGYSDNRWLSFDEASKEGYQIKKGEKSTEIVYYSFFDPKTKEAYEQPKVRTVKVFNAEQLVGIEQMPERQPDKEEILEKVQSIFENSQVKIVNNQKDKVFYRQKDDTIYMPPKEAYKDELAYSSAAIHELCRWAGTGEERLNFPAAPFGTEAFAREKLRTEIAAYMIIKELGLDYEPHGQQFAEQWANIIEKDPTELLRAAKFAEKIKGFVMQYENTLEKQLEQELPYQELTEKKYFDGHDYFGIAEYGPGGTHYFNIYSISQIHAAFEEKRHALVDIDHFINQMESAIEINQIADSELINYDEDEIEENKNLITIFRERLNQAEQAKKDGYTYVVENTTDSNNIYFLEGKELNEILHSIEFHPSLPVMLDVQSWNIQPKSFEDIYLTVPQKDIAQVKELGAEYDEEKNQWYVPKDTNLEPFKDWMYIEIPLQEKQTKITHEQQISQETADAALQKGLQSSKDTQQPQKEMIKLFVPREEKDDAKSLGAKWFPKEKTWYVPEGTDLQPFYKWLPKEKKVELIIASRDYLNVPREEKDEAKALGAKWDKWQKAWYVEKGTDLAPFAKWGKLDLKERAVEQQKQENTIEQTQLPKQEQKAGQNIAETKTYIAVPWGDNDEAKKLGAKWDWQNKSWYVEKGQNLTLFKEWLIDENTVLPVKQETLSPEAEFTQYLRDCGLDVDKAVMDGQIHRVPVIGKPGGKDGAYCGYLDGIPSGWVQNYVTGEKSTFISTGVKLSEEEKARQRAEYAQKQQEREERRKAEHDNAANKAVDIYLNAQNNPQHAYLEKKGIQPYCAKINHYGQLVIPMENTEVFRGVQFINEDGSKQFLPGIEKKGSFAVLNSEQKELSEVLVCEGFATGASLHEATKLPVIVAFDAGNLEPVAKSIHDKFKSAITICADNDQHKENNVGLEYARKAALAVGGKLAVPQFTAEEKARKLTDFNDLHKSQGLEAVKRQVSQAKLLQQNQTKTQNKQLSR